MATQAERTITIWRVVDGKPGHEAQSLGLCNALSRQIPSVRCDLSVEGRPAPLSNLLLGSYPPGDSLPAPDLIVGAGHRTHLHLLAARRARGGKAIVLMRPSLPASLFDLSIIPRHDQYRGRGCYLETRGVLNALYTGGEHDAGRSLILIGGPSRHFQWDGAGLIDQLENLVADNPAAHHVLTTSRRTPPGFLSALHQRGIPRVQVFPFEETDRGWVARRLAESGTAWVTEDSVSMIYEALTAGTAVGVLRVPKKGVSRITRGLDVLLADGCVFFWDEAGADKSGMKPMSHFNEAERCATWIRERWLTSD